MRAFLQLYRANWSEFLGDRRALFLTVAFPVILILLFGVLFSNPDKVNANVGLVVDGDAASISEQLAVAFEALPKGTGQSDALPGLKFRRGAKAEMLDQLRRGQIDAIITIPAFTPADLSGGGKLQLSLTADLSRGTMLGFLKGVVDGLLRVFEARLNGGNPIVSLKLQSVQARELRSIDFLLPGILALSILQIGLFATPQGLIAMRVSGVLKRLGATPLPRSTLLLAYISMRLTVALVQTAILVAIGRAVFGVAMLGSWWQFSGWVLLGTLAFISLGFFTAAVARSEESGTAIANLMNLPMILLGGIFFQIDDLPPFLMKLINLLPLPYLADAFRQTMVDAPPAHSLLACALMLGAWTVGAALLAVRFFQWEQR
jgi:ABC-2 type transport system permease protein